MGVDADRLLRFVGRVSLFLDTPEDERMIEEEDEIMMEAEELLIAAGWISDPERNR